MPSYYRGGPSLAPRMIDVIINRKTGLLTPTRGVSVFGRPDGLDRFGGAYKVGAIPESLRIVQTGRNPYHFEIVPAQAMTFAEYEEAIGKIILTPV